MRRDGHGDLAKRDGSRDGRRNGRWVVGWDVRDKRGDDTGKGYYRRWDMGWAGTGDMGGLLHGVSRDEKLDGWMEQRVK